MQSRSNAVVFVITCLVLAAVLGCSVGSRIVSGPVPPTPTPTATRRPTFTPTGTNTPTPPSTPTFTPTPVPTQTPTEPATDTPVPKPPTPTPPPQQEAPPPPPPPTDTPIPAPPAPTDTPAPTTPFVGSVVTGFPNCGSTGVFGYVKDTGGNNVDGAHIRVWTDTWDGVWGKSRGDSFGIDGDRNFEVKIADAVVANTWHVAIVNGEESTETLSPVIDITSSQHCEGDGAVQWTKIDFTKHF